MTRRFAPFAAVLLLAGCSLVPDFAPPDPPVPADWPEGPAYRTPPTVTPVSTSTADSGDPTRPADGIGWREVMRDAKLQKLVETALANNRDLRVAVLNVQAAEADYRAQRGDLFPTISGSGSASWSRVPASTTSAGSALGKTAGGESRSYSAGIGFTSYELDLFGRVRALTEQAFEQYLGYEETRRSTQISLVAQVATAYLTLLADRSLLDLTRLTLESQEASYQLTRMSFNAGNATELTLRQAQSSVDTARTNLALYTRQVAQDENALSLLLGQPLPPELASGASLDAQPVLTDLPPGLSSSILLRRPNVMAAEHNLRAANANIGAARAAFFPSLTLTAKAGTASAGLQSLFTPSSSTWSFAPSLSIPIFSAGANEANLDLAKVQKDVQVATYEKTVQTAFREVADALVARSTYYQQIAAQQSLVDSYARSYQLSLMRFRSGADNYLTALDAQRSLYSAQQTLITLKAARLQNLVALYKVLGGGWQ